MADPPPLRKNEVAIGLFIGGVALLLGVFLIFGIVSYRQGKKDYESAIAEAKRIPIGISIQDLESQLGEPDRSSDADLGLAYKIDREDGRHVTYVYTPYSGWNRPGKMRIDAEFEGGIVNRVVVKSWGFGPAETEVSVLPEAMRVKVPNDMANAPRGGPKLNWTDPD